MQNIYEICYYGGLILAILLFIAAVILFIVLKIPNVIGELTGRNAKKGIQDIRKGQGSDHSVSKSEQAKYYNQGTGKIKVRETVSSSARKENGDDTTDLLKPEAAGTETDETAVLGAGGYAASTDVLAGKDDDATDVLAGGADDDATDVLTGGADDDATDVLTGGADDDATDILTGVADDDATDVLTSDIDGDATDVLTSVVEDDDATSILTGNMTDRLSRRGKVYYNIVVTHTDETL